MTTFVVDTNVAITANGRETHTDERCQLECVQTLRAMVAGKVIAIDDRGLILREYATHLRWSGQPGTGDAFFKHVWNSQGDPTRVRRVPVTPSDDRRGFEELPLNTFDRSDRKFLAVAVVANAAVLNATDSDWNEHKALTEELGVEVRQLCPQHATK